MEKKDFTGIEGIQGMKSDWNAEEPNGRRRFYHRVGLGVMILGLLGVIAGYLFYRQQQTQESTTRQPAQSDPKSATDYVSRGNGYAEKGENDQAIADYTQAIRIDPNAAAAYYNRGNLYSDKGEYDRALADYTQAIRLSPKDSLAYLNRAMVYRDRGEYDQAVADYTQAIRIDPKFWKAYYNRSFAYNKLGKTELCIQDLKQVQQLTDDLDLRDSIDNLLKSISRATPMP
jgi:tetratricopeptide (TPR) repeat protein